MKTSLLSLSAFCLGLTVLLSPAVSRADDPNPPVVVNALPDLSVPVGTSQSVVKLKKTFGLSGVTGAVERFNTTVGNVDVQMLSGSAPNTVATFLSYANNAQRQYREQFQLQGHADPAGGLGLHRAGWRVLRR